MNESQYSAIANALDTSESFLPNPKGLEPLLGERGKHRNILFNFSCYLTIASFCLLAGVVIVQMTVRVHGDPTFEIMDNVALETLAVSVFGQILGVVYIIAKSLWDGKEFDMYKNK